jgi:CRISPR-associated protein Cas2
VAAIRGRVDRDLYLVSYDVVQDQRRAKIHKILCVQFSVFECWLTHKELLILREKLICQIDPRKDRLRIYALCVGCATRVEVIGGALPTNHDVYVV